MKEQIHDDFVFMIKLYGNNLHRHDVELWELMKKAYEAGKESMAQTLFESTSKLQ
jgi:hypothetical protein